jgi:hypothetical protein
MQEVSATPVQTELSVVVRAYGTQRGGLGEHIEEAIEGALRTHHAGAAGISFERDEDARLSDQLFRARRVGLERISIRLTALRALCAPVGGLDAADVRTITFYLAAMKERPVALVMDDADWELPAFVVTKSLAEAVAEPDMEPESEPEAAADSEPQLEPQATPEPEPVVEASPPAWLEHVHVLEAARGPQTLAAFERLFVNHYLPLASAVDAGKADARAAAAREELRRTFERAYSEALPAFALTGKRPRMVLDAFDVAAKMARAHRARSAQVLVTSSMRYDLAASVVERVTELLEGRATIADRATLFSALPTTTSRQLSTLARGLEGLRSADSERGETHARRTAHVVRRVRVGSRDLYTLDIVDTMLDAAGADAIDMLGDVCEQASSAIAKHAGAQASRTLLLVLGDHGFRFDRGEARHGGASPEEVIVSAHALMLGDVH